MTVTRRFFLRATGLAAAYCALSPLDLLAGDVVAASQPAATPVRKGKTLVVIFLRGGTDGLNLVVPYREQQYYAMRKSLAVPPPGAEGGAIALDERFALHPRLAALQDAFEKQYAVALHAVGYDRNSRSHFEEQDVWETGLVGNTLESDGWLNRHLATSTGQGVIRAVAIGDSLPRILRGDVPAYAIRGLDDLTLPDSATDRKAVMSALEHAYRGRQEADAMQAQRSRQLLADTGRATLDSLRELQAVAEMPYEANAEYPNTSLARRLREAARLIRADIGGEVIELDRDGWDTHNNQGAGAGGTFGSLAQQFGDAVAAFTRDIEDRLDDVMVITLSDFGRTAAENGTRGTDHGWGNCLFAFGGPVRAAQRDEARPVITDWPGLAPDQLHDGRDLKHTLDFRDVLGQVVRTHLGNAQLDRILPGHACKPLDFIA